MTDFEIYKEHIQHTHNAFCRVVIRHAAIDAARRVHKRREREISLDYLIDEKYCPFSTTDEYFAEPAPDIDYPFTVCGQTVLLSNPILAAALPLLSEQILPRIKQRIKTSEGAGSTGPNLLPTAKVGEKRPPFFCLER